MSYLLYMKRSFTRSPRRHAVLFAVLTCAFLLPLLICIYRDSNAWGTRQYLLARSAGETYHIGNAAEADVPCFEGIRGLSAPIYRDGTIYLHILSDEDWRNAESVTVYENEIRKRMEVSGNEALLPTAFSYEYAHGISTDPSHLSGQRSLLLVNMLVILLSVSVVRSAYRSHLKRFSSDIGTLRACGASRRQISALLAAELAAVFLLAAACAVVLSVVSLKALFTAFLEIRHDSLAWLIFHVEPMNILLHLAVFFVTLGLSLGMTLHRYSREPARALLNDAENAPKVKRGRKPIRRRFTPAATLCGLWRSRTNRSLRSCLAVSVPVMAVFLLLFNILTVALQVTGAEEEWGLKVSRSSHGGEVFSAEDMAYVSSLVGVKQTRPVYEPDGYILLPESPEEVETALRAHFAGAEYAVTNRQSGSDFLREMSSGVYLLLGYIFAALFLLILLILYVRLCDYIEGSRPLIRSLHRLGASKRTLYRSYIWQDGISAAAAVTAPFLISLPLTALLCAWQKAPLRLDGGMLAAYAALAALLLFTYWHPVHRSLKRVLRPL